jgi:hypothetical protein
MDSKSNPQTLYRSASSRGEPSATKLEVSCLRELKLANSKRISTLVLPVAQSGQISINLVSLMGQPIKIGFQN